jgi:CheY-like chemotaxis protein
MALPARRPLILIVEDEPTLREFLGDALRGAELDVVTVDLAQHALDAVNRNRPDLILLDLGMPRGTMQGMDFLVLLRESDQWKSLPVIILSAYGDLVNRDVTARLRVAAVLSKPMLDVPALISVVRDHLPRLAS